MLVVGTSCVVQSLHWARGVVLGWCVPQVQECEKWLFSNCFAFPQEAFHCFYCCFSSSIALAVTGAAGYMVPLPPWYVTNKTRRQYNKAFSRSRLYSTQGQGHQHSSLVGVN